MRERNPYVYTCWKNASEMSNDVCGTYINFDSVDDLEDGFEVTVKIPVKINLHQILMLSSVRYLPSFCGRWEIELYPNWNNLVVLPVPVGKTPHHYQMTTPDMATPDFTQIGKKFTMIDDVVDSTWNANQVVTCIEGD
jgi:hypothetical protein